MNDYNGKWYHIHRLDFFNWGVYGGGRHAARLIATFWTKRGAQKVADKLNRFDVEKAEIVRMEAEYDEMVKRVMSTPIQPQK